MGVTDILNQVGVEREMVRLIKILGGECLDEMQEVSVRAAEAEVRYKVKYSQSILSASGAMALRSAQATIACEAELRERLVSDRLVTVQREKLGAYKASLDSLRTLLVGVRNEVNR